MKKTNIILISAILPLVLTSCATTSQTTSEEQHSSHDKSSPKAIITVQKTPEELFLESIEGYSVKKVSSPKEITLGRTFAAPYVFEVTKADGTPAENFSLTLSYPAAKAEGVINFEKIELISDAEGKITFTAEKPAFSAKTLVSVYPTPVSEDEALAEQLKNYTASADWKVKSDIATKGAALFVWDFNEKDRPVNNSYNIQAEFRGRGITNVGNGPVNESSYIGKIKSLYKDTYDIIGTSVYGYLLFGTIKFEQPVTALEDGTGYYCILKAEIGALNMKNGNQIYSSVITYEAKGKNWNECVSVGKDKLSQLVVDDIMYGL